MSIALGSLPVVFRTSCYVMRYLSGKDLSNLIPPATLVTAIETGLRDFAGRKALVPQRAHLDFGDNTLLTMPVFGEGSFGTKIVSVVPSNAARGVPVVNGLMILNDGATGVPLAVLDAASLTAQRTGAVGGVALKCTTPPDTDRVGIIGTGVQGTWQAIFACAVRKVHTLYFIARSDEKALRFVNGVSPHVSSVRFSRCADVQELLTKSQVVIAATTSSEPVLPANQALLANKHFISVGSFKPSMIEFPGLVYQLAQTVVVDSDAAQLEVGDLTEPLSRGLLQEANIVHLADLVSGKRTVDTTRTTAVKSVGMALYDLYAARAFLDAAERLGRGTPLDTRAG
ncbi:MAG: ornithine cyclodeaminase family protein [Gammaproteobacteria bacterium]